ncbi:Mn superoxide dismutase [Rhizoctonia solani AG-1 IA]|uniref:superoxide dismutase n=1 Tax=Thanatephorus cucumeris (strain AG1-IA) TaxID=983506 RepID=L8WQN8_THACA|nr:Mn superoxide dismutase [Rhizoctonia solani AG-1 IA]
MDITVPQIVAPPSTPDVFEPLDFFDTIYYTDPITWSDTVAMLERGYVHSEEQESIDIGKVEGTRRAGETTPGARDEEVREIGVPRAHSAGDAMTDQRYKIRSRSRAELPELPYAYNALEPHISAEIMTLHHKKHHQTYVNGYNTAIESAAKLIGDTSAGAARQQISLQSAIKFNGGGHINHSLFWKNLAPADGAGGKLQPGLLADVINRDFGSFDNFKTDFNAASLGIQGSGWGWYVYNTSSKRTEIITTPNQDPVLPAPYVPLFGVDMWEHAFYLQYKNVKPDVSDSAPNTAWEAEKRLNDAGVSKL